MSNTKLNLWLIFLFGASFVAFHTCQITNALETQSGECIVELWATKGCQPCQTVKAWKPQFNRYCEWREVDASSNYEAWQAIGSPSLPTVRIYNKSGSFQKQLTWNQGYGVNEEFKANLLDAIIKVNEACRRSQQLQGQSNRPQGIPKRPTDDQGANKSLLDKLLKKEEPKEQPKERENQEEEQEERARILPLIDWQDKLDRQLDKALDKAEQRVDGKIEEIKQEVSQTWNALKWRLPLLVIVCFLIARLTYGLLVKLVKGFYLANKAILIRGRNKINNTIATLIENLAEAIKAKQVESSAKTTSDKEEKGKTAK